MDLIRENSHNNDVSTFYDTLEKKYHKIASTSAGKKLITSDANGISYFNSLNKKYKINYKLKKQKKNYRLIIDQINGKKVNYNDPFDKNYLYCQKLINYYLLKWPNTKIQKCHGDLTLDNIIFDKKKISIIDWEHHKKSKQIFYGYDLIYFLLSGILLPGENNFNIKSRLNFKRLYINLYKSKIKKEFLDDPIGNINKVISNVLTEQIIASPFKFITFSCKKNFLNEIKNFINKDIVNDRFK